jgi:hypothetical protein
MAPDVAISETEPASEAGQKARSVPDTVRASFPEKTAQFPEKERITVLPSRAVALSNLDLTDFVVNNLDGARRQRRQAPLLAFRGNL